MREKIVLLLKFKKRAGFRFFVNKKNYFVELFFKQHKNFIFVFKVHKFKRGDKILKFGVNLQKMYGRFND